jgi:hypothetical protein
MTYIYKNVRFTSRRYVPYISKVAIGIDGQIDRAIFYPVYSQTFLPVAFLIRRQLAKNLRKLWETK